MDNFIKEKTQEIAFAVLRVSAYMRRFDLRRKLEELSYHLIENVYYENTELAINTISAISGFLILAKNIHELEPINFRILNKELENLKDHINKDATGLNNSISEIFKVKALSASIKKPIQLLTHYPEIKESENTAVSAFPIPIAESIKTQTKIQSPKNNITKNLLNASDRKGKVLEYIKNSPGMKLQFKDIISAFANVSDRTIRNDLKELCASGRLGKEEKGGPRGYYFVRL